jgi:hypothetical protein
MKGLLALKFHFIGAGPAGEIDGGVQAIIVERTLLVQIIEIVGSYAVLRFVLAESRLQGVQVLKNFIQCHDVGTLSTSSTNGTIIAVSGRSVNLFYPQITQMRIDLI